MNTSEIKVYGGNIKVISKEIIPTHFILDGPCNKIKDEAFNAMKETFDIIISESKLKELIKGDIDKAVDKAFSLGVEEGKKQGKAEITDDKVNLAKHTRNKACNDIIKIIEDNKMLGFSLNWIIEEIRKLRDGKK